MRPEAFLQDLNSQQLEAVLATEGPILILAGPGSGKTKTLTSRIAYLISKGVPVEQILALTFTNKAAEEMKTRISALIPNSKFQIPNSSLFAGTFHSFAAKILRANASKLGYQKTFSILDDGDALSLIKELLKELEINPKQFSPGAVLNTISRLKNELITPERYLEEAGDDFFPKTVHRIYEAYQKRIYASNAMDFDDLLMNACLLFDRYPEILASYQNNFRYIHVDEYQDVNQAQYLLVQKLAQKYGNIAVVGDDAQAIYGFRGADLRNILNFEKDWPETRIIMLDQNYRSTQTILDAASKMISGNTAQKKKALWTERKGGEAIKLLPAVDERAEARLVVAKIEELLGQGYSLKDLAVLYRTNAQSRVMEEALLERNFPYKIVGGIRFYQRREIKDILAYLRYLLNPQDSLSLKRIINVPARGIGPRTLLAYLQNNFMGIPQKSLAGLKEFGELVKILRAKLAEEKPSKFIKDLLKAIHYRDYLADDRSNAEERWEMSRNL
jgi:DNA helicase-2/ATP-dependent DNA helicase PcrA